MPATSTVPVTAVLVSHDGARWLPTVLAALAAQTVRPSRVVAVDTGSTDGSADLLRADGLDVLVLPRTTGFGQAVHAGLAAAPAADWVWLLHDDAAPAPDALEQLLGADPGTALRGPKALDWTDPRTLLEVGLTTDGAGRRITGVELGEQDQGQRDGTRDVLAVGTAGALVRRTVWDAVGGLDPQIALFGDDLDLGRRVCAAGHRVAVVPAATVRHARAATTGRRRLGDGRRPVAADRRGRALALLASTAPAALVPVALRLLVTTVLHAVLLLLGRRPRAALDELAALGVLARPARLLRARRRRRASRVVASSALRPLLARPGDRWRSGLASLVGRVAAAGLPADRRRPGPGLLLVAGLAALALLAERSLLRGGALAGGRLLPAPDGASDLLGAYADGGAPATGLLGLAGGLLLGRAPLAVELLVLASVPAAGAVAFVVAGRVVRRPVLRLWAAATWALLPVATGAVAAGRLDACVVQIALPAGLLAGHGLVTQDPRGRWQRAWALGLGLAAVVALAPVVWPLAALLLLGTALALMVRSPDRAAATRRVLAALVVVLVPLPLLPLDAGALLHGPGRLVAGLADPGLGAWRLPLLSPGGPGLPAVGVTAGLLLGALGALLRRDRARTVAAGWALALVGLAAATALARTEVDGQPVWPGVPLQLAAAGLLLAALVGAEGLPEQLQRNAFGRRQLVAVLVVAAAAAVPALCAAAWVVRGADDPLRRGPSAVLPAFVRAELAAGDLRALVLEPGDGGVSYAVTGADGPRLGDPPPLVLDDVVADLLSPRGSDAAAALSTRAVRYVALSRASEQDAAALDAQPGLLRQPGQDPLLWRVAAPASRLLLLSPGAATTAARDRAPTVAGTPVTDRLPPGPAGRLLVLAEPQDAGWTAHLDGVELPGTTAYGWARAWSVPPQGGRLEVAPDGRSLPLTAVVLVVLLVLAGPGGPRRRGLERVR